LQRIVLQVGCASAFTLVYSSHVSRFKADAFDIGFIFKKKNKVMELRVADPGGPVSPAARKERGRSPSRRQSGEEEQATKKKKMSIGDRRENVFA